LFCFYKIINISASLSLSVRLPPKMDCNVPVAFSFFIAYSGEHPTKCLHHQQGIQYQHLHSQYCFL
jgi:hypothetical protein